MSIFLDLWLKYDFCRETLIVSTGAGVAWAGATPFSTFSPFWGSQTDIAGSTMSTWGTIRVWRWLIAPLGWSIWVWWWSIRVRWWGESLGWPVWVGWWLVSPGWGGGRTSLTLCKDLSYTSQKFGINVVSITASVVVSTVKTWARIETWCAVIWWGLG